MFRKGFFGGTRNFTGLFYCLLAMFVVVPFFEYLPLAEELFVLCFSGILILTLYSLYGLHEHFLFNTTLGVMALGTNIFAYLTPYTTVDKLSLAINIVFFGYAIVLMYKSVFRASSINTNVILGAICVYLLMGAEWGMIDSLIDLLIPNSYNVATSAMMQERTDTLLFHFIYYSFVTLSTLGYGDIVPVSTPARFISALEAITGQIYLSVLVARLVGMHITQKAD